MKRLLLMIGMSLILVSSVPAMDFSGAGTMSVAPVACGENTINPIIVANNEYPCPGGVYCEHYGCGEPFCCPWGYFYSNPCTCLCYKSSYDAGSDCDTYFRCN